jgi:hypothetical protein
MNYGFKRKNNLREYILKIFEPVRLREWKNVIREKGWKEFLRQYGWKVIVVFVLFYLIRDTIFYILIPYLILNNVITCQ